MKVLVDALREAVAAVVAVDLGALSVEEVQQQVTFAAPAAEQLTGFAALAGAELHRRTAGRLPTDDVRTRSVAGWIAEATGDIAAAAGRLVRTSTALKDGLPLVADALLDGTVTLAKAEVLTRLVGRIEPAVFGTHRQTSS